MKSLSFAFIPASFDESPACQEFVSTDKKEAPVIFIPLQLTTSPFLCSHSSTFMLHSTPRWWKSWWTSQLEHSTRHQLLAYNDSICGQVVCLFIFSRHSIYPSGRRRAESSATIRLLFLFYGRDSAVPYASFYYRDKLPVNIGLLNHLWAAAL